jgi:hypothetical protein
MLKVWTIEALDPDDGYGPWTLGYFSDLALAQAIYSDLIDRLIDEIEEERYYAEFDTRELPDFIRRFPELDSYFSLYRIRIW